MSVEPREFYTPKILDAQLTGMIRTREPGICSARLRVPVGILTSEVAERLAAAARRFGRGELYLTARLGIEIPGVCEEEFTALREHLAGLGVDLAGCGPRSRSTVTCKGTVCPHGNGDTFALAWDIERSWNDATPLPHKFKVAVAGCASSCSKPQVNDVGLLGVSRPELAPGPCTGCGVCAEACHLTAVRLEAGHPLFDPARCVRCGDCIKACPFEALRAVEVGFDLYVGGRWGREKQVGARLAASLTRQEAVAAVGRVKTWYREEGRAKERLGETMLRVGLPSCQQAFLAGVDPAKWVAITPEAVAAFRVLPRGTEGVRGEGPSKTDAP